MAENDIRRFPKTIYAAVGVLGFTMGLFTGWSSSPAVGTLMSGIFGLLSGGFLAVFALQKRDEVEPAVRLDGPALKGISLSLILICVTSILGTIAGINVRNGNLAAMVGYGEHEELSNLPVMYKDLPPVLTAKLVLFQRSLNGMGVGQAENNALLESIALACRNELPSSEELDAVRDDLSGLYLVRRAVVLNAEVIRGLDPNNWRPVEWNFGFGKVQRPEDLVEVAERAAGPVNLDAFFRRLNAFPYDRGSQEQRLDFILQNTKVELLSNQQETPSDAPSDSPPAF